MAARLKSRNGVLDNMWNELPMDGEPEAQEKKKPRAKVKDKTPEPAAQKETVEKEKSEAKAKKLPVRSRGTSLDTKDILNKKERVAISLTGNTKKRLEKISEENGISISSAIQLIILSYYENPTYFYKEGSELLSDVEKVAHFNSLNFSDLEKRNRLREEEKRMTSQYTLAPAINKLISDETVELGLPLKMRSRVYNAIINKYLDVKKQ